MPIALVESYLASLVERRRLSPHTSAAYRRDLQQLFTLIGPVEPHAVQPHTLRTAAATLRSRGANPRSIARSLSAWRGFFGWLVQHHGLAANPAGGLKAPKGRKSLPKALSPDAAAHLLDRKVQGDLEIRDAAMLELFYSSGLRLAELHGVSLDEAHAAIRDGEISVLGKGSKRRVVPVGAKARDALAGWIAVRAPIARAEETALFVSVRGTRLAMRSIQVRVAQWAESSGVGVPVHPHVLRHSFASHVLQSSGDLRAVQEMLGHASIAATQVYTSLDWQHLARVYDAAHPRAKKK